MQFAMLTESDWTIEDWATSSFCFFVFSTSTSNRHQAVISTPHDARHSKRHRHTNVANSFHGGENYCNWSSYDIILHKFCKESAKLTDLICCKFAEKLTRSLTESSWNLSPSSSVMQTWGQLTSLCNEIRYTTIWAESRSNKQLIWRPDYAWSFDGSGIAYLSWRITHSTLCVVPKVVLHHTRWAWLTFYVSKELNCVPWRTP